MAPVLSSLWVLNPALLGAALLRCRTPRSTTPGLPRLASLTCVGHLVVDPRQQRVLKRHPPPAQPAGKQAGGREEQAAEMCGGEWEWLGVAHQCSCG